ncbi:MAG: PKD domain-containing protein [Bacteroidetes bacterium]|nr:PKD domain-containing protein [Bacteroidota bacterium]
MKTTLRTLKGLALFAMTFGSAGILYGQNYLINENFDNFPSKLNSIASGWTGVTISGDSTVDFWQFNNSIGYDISSPLNGQVALADAYMGGYPGSGSNNTNAQDLALISPTVSTAGLTNLTLTFDELYLQLGSSATYVEISTNGGSSWTSVYSTSSGGFFTRSKSINLSTYVGYSSVKIRFRWTKPGSTSQGYWMVDNVKLFSRYANDVGVEALLDPQNNSCPDPSQSLSLKVTNFGTSSATSIGVNLGVSGGSTGSFSTTIPSLSAGSSINVFTGNTINTTSGGNIYFSGYSTYAGDQTTSNDTLNVTVITAPKPTDPSGNAIVQCGIGPVNLSANALTGEETVWYNDSTTSASLGSGNPFHYSNTVYASRNFYAENTRNLPSEFSTGLTGVYRYNSSNTKAIFFDLTATNEIRIDSIASNFAYNGRYICSVFVKSGSYYGNTTNQSAFTLLTIDTVDANVLGQPAFISLDGLNFRVGSGQSYGFAITARTAPGSNSNYPSFAFKLGTTNNLSNSDMVIYANDVAETAFSNYLTGYSGDVHMYYQKVCKSQRKPIQVVIVPRPAGVDIIEGTGNNGAFRSGTLVVPDVARLNDTFEYEISAPTGYSNSDFGVKWVITDLSIMTGNGTGPNTTDTMTSAPGANNGMLRFIPSDGVDSLFLVKVTVLDMVKMCDTTVMRYLLVGADPHAHFSALPSCEGDVLSFNNNSTIASGFMTFRWFFGDGDSSTIANPNHTYTLHNSYTVRVIATSNFGFVSTFDSTIAVYEIPKADFTTLNVCDGETHQFTDASSIPSIGTPVYSWDFGDGLLGGNTANPTHTYSSAGVYQVTQHVDVNGCSNEKSRYVTLAPRAVPSFNTFTECNNNLAQFTNTSTLAFGSFGSTWKFGDGNSSTEKNARHRYNTFGNIDATLIITTDLGCMDSVTSMISLIESPTPDFSLSSACSEEMLQVNNTTNIPSTGTNSYQWDFGNGTKSSLDNPTVSYAGTGDYTIKMWVFSTNGCSDSLERMVTIDTKPIAGFVADDVCDGTPVKFRNNTINIPGPVTFAWDFDNGLFSSADDTTVLYSGKGAYNVSLYVNTVHGCTDTVTQTVIVNEVPNSGFTVNSGQKGDGTMAFQGTAGSGYKYQWDLGDGFKEQQQTFVHTYSHAGNYTVSLTVTTNAGCLSYNSQIISVFPTGLVDPKQVLHYYPNPSTGTVQLDLSELSGVDYQLVIRDIQGKELIQQNLIGGTIHKLDLSHLPAGTYMIEIEGAGVSLTGKLTLLD